ncbi:hypothetical protein [Paraliomyxa miuraensis]|uniref:hypothetical protein n=1 Tax=Paraliomyxa miuraensis TaxID=376150 RepID=UPI002251E8C1|nr:hypothetical protein [Paraliomyxa miuraensis]MCX4244228.1 hypothetical protein [Paraliomyxa miuraensis]
MKQHQVKLGQQYQDLDPRRVERIGTVVCVRRYSVRLRWNISGHTTMVARRQLSACGSRGYVLIEDVKEPPVALLPVAKPTTAGDRRAGFDAQGWRLWKCLGCGAKGRLRRPWRVLVWTRGAWAERSTVVCSDECHRRVTGGHDAR